MYNLISKLYFLSRFNKKLIIIFFELNICVISFLFSLIIINKSFNIPLTYDFILISILSLSFFPIFFIFGFYSVVFRYLDFFFLIKVVAAIILYTIIYSLIFYIIQIDQIKFPTILLHSLVFLILILYFRIIINVTSDWFHSNINQKNKNLKKAVIYGAGSAGVAALKSLNNYNILAFLDDDINKSNMKISNIPIYSPDKINKLLKENLTFEIFVSIPSLSLSDRKKIIRKTKSKSILMKFLPNIKDFTDGMIEVNDFKTIEPEDLIDRQINWDVKKINKLYRNKIICITGAGGSIGSEICKQILLSQPNKVIIVDHSELNLFNVENSLKKILDDNKSLNVKIVPILGSLLDQNILTYIFNHKPEIIFHAAAYKHVNMIEENPFIGVNNNVVGTFNIVDKSIESKCEKFIFISTDKAVNPTSIMGASKRIAEKYIQNIPRNHKTIFSIVRFGNVLGSSGSVFELFKNQIKNGGPITITDINVTRYFMSIKEAVGLVLEASLISGENTTFVLKMGDPIKVINLAKKMINLSGLRLKENEKDGDIEFKIIGLKPGEKLFEELIFDKDYFETNHPDIMIIDNKNYDTNYSENIKNETLNILSKNDLSLLRNYIRSHIEGNNFK